MSNTFKKTNRKNKTNLSISWIPGHFTIEDLLAKNSNFIEITLRSHVKTAKNDNVISEIGCFHNGKGRPKLVYALTPVTKEVLESARQAGVIFNEQYDSIAVVNVDSVKVTLDEEAESAAQDEAMNEHQSELHSANVNV